jgi:two-component system response regulator (stage 0 sporulation protein A)
MIIDDNRELTDIIAHYLQQMEGFVVTGCAHDGEEGLRMLREDPPNMVLLDLMMPRKDGFYVLEELLNHQPGTKPVCVVFTGMNRESAARSAFRKGADFFIVKPIDMELLTRRVREIWQDQCQEAIPAVHPAVAGAKKTPEAFAFKSLHEMSFSNTLDGYAYITSALYMAIADKSILRAVTKRLYPDVAKEHGVTDIQVERAMRHAIANAWKKGGGAAFVRIVGYGGTESPRPTNSAFIAALTECYLYA